MIYIASDHGGYELKQKLVHLLEKEKANFEDLGPAALNSKDDYPDFAKKVALEVAKNPSKHIGILMCRSGQGMCVAANKIKGIRAVSAWNKKLAYSGRNDDFGNILCLASDHLKVEEALEIVHIFIHTRYSKSPRHLRRIKKIKKMEGK